LKNDGMGSEYTFVMRYGFIKILFKNISTILFRTNQFKRIMNGIVKPIINKGITFLKKKNPP